MEWVVTTGKSIAEAKELALDELGVDEQEAEFEVLEEAKSGVFGIGRQLAQVRARIKPKKPPAKDDGRRRNKRNGKRTDTRSRGPKSDSRASSDSSDKSERNSKSSSRRRSNNKNREASASSSDAAAATPKEKKVAEAMTLDEQAELGSSFVHGLLEAIDASGVIRQEIDSEEGLVHVDVSGDDLGFLVGARGRTLFSIQDLARASLHISGKDVQGQLLLDIGGYRAKRREALERFAAKVHQEVSEGGKEVALEPMSSADRKVLHDALKALGGVETHSEGEEPRRRIVVTPV